MRKPKFKAKARWMKGLGGKAISKPPKPVKATVLKILGCGTSTGTPVLCCDCRACRSRDPKNKRTRASVAFQVGNKVLLVDTSPDLRLQAMREKVFWIDAVLFTHPHADHVHGIDELRSFNFLMRKSIPCFGNTWTIKAIRRKFDYIFKTTQEGGGKPVLDLHRIDEPMKIAGVQVVPLEVIHGSLKVLGYRINNIAYITDCSYIPAKTLDKLNDLDVLVLDCLRETPHPTHFNVEGSLAIAKRIGARRTILTHLAHDIEYGRLTKMLPKNVFVAYDGLTVRAH